MYSDTVTLFNRYERDGVTLWLPTVLRGVDLNIDRAAIVAKYGEQSADNARLHVRYTPDAAGPIIQGKRYVPPKLWALQTEEEAAQSITFAGGNSFDFFAAAEWDEPAPILDDPSEWLDGFYNYVNSRYDYVFAISEVAMYSVIPHFEIGGK